jgi:hypothetical protein
VTADLLSVWTDSDTAMHAAGASLGIFDRVPGNGTGLPAESPLRNALFDLLLTLVDAGELEKRACADGRYAFRWRSDVDSTAVSTDATSARLDACLEAMPRALPSRVELTPASAAPGPPALPAPLPPAGWPRIVATTAPLLLPSLSCLLALVAYVAFGPAIGLVVLGLLALVGGVGLVRRVPLAGFWTAGLIVAGLLLRLS